MSEQFCKRHNVDHYGTWCGFCVNLWKKHSAQLKKLRAQLRIKKRKTK